MAIAKPRRPVEPAGRVGDQRRDYRGLAEQADQQAVRQVQVPLAVRLTRQQGAEADHDAAEQDRINDAALVHPKAHDDTAGAGPDHQQRIGEGRHGAQCAEIGGDRLEGDEQDIGRAEADAVQRQRGEQDHPAIGNLDTVFAPGHVRRAFMEEYRVWSIAPLILSVRCYWIKGGNDRGGPQLPVQDRQIPN